MTHNRGGAWAGQGLISSRLAATVAAVAVGLALVVMAPSARAAGPTCVPRSSSTDWKSALVRARAAEAKALTAIDHSHYREATHQLKVMRRQTRTAHTAATRLIGRPPSDPESDDPPGVEAVLKVGRFEHQLTMKLVPSFGTLHGRRVSRPLGHGVTQAVACRAVMLSKVVALSAGKRDDYVDGLSDTLPQYTQELSRISTELAGDGVTSGGRIVLSRTQHVVSATGAMMQRVFGGGERSAG